MSPSNYLKTQDPEAMKDYRQMLYRLDLATSFGSFEELFHHFMKETLFDGFIEIRVYSVTSNPNSPARAFPTPSTRLSFVRDPLTGNVVADRLFKPAQRLHEKDPSNLYRQQYRVEKRYLERPPLLDVFRPIVEPLLNGNKSTLIFEYRAFLEQASRSSFDEFEVVTRQVPHRLMVGYIGRSDQGPLAVYQLDENIARTAFLDMNPMSFQYSPPDSDLGRECVIA
ncbi:unnamed protein product [Rhizoctonia solani]|uniref:Uncharacterized protein n=1 Tax=Rhizoctonia solani TaxID=456999 RepID=A0A8H3ADE1_9AGAM|nr:unnamed protein product [Rhizoctonia solani]